MLTHASELLSSDVDQVIVAGVDSYLDFERLALLDENWELKSDRNADGFIPGEAAVALLFQTASQAARRNIRPRLTIERVAFGEEPNVFASDYASTGVGLTEAIRGVAPSRCPWVLCDLNGQSPRAFEWGTASVRLGAPLANVKKLEHPAECMGDIGAASGALLLACAAAAFERGYAPADQALMWTASSTPLRAAALVSRPGD